MYQTQTKQATYSFKTAGTITARYADGRTRRAFHVLVTNLLKQVTYSVLVPVDGKTPPTCQCLGWQYYESCRQAGCVHVHGALGHLIQEQEAARPSPAVSPAIRAQIGENGPKPEWRERAEEQERVARATRDRDRLW